MCSQILPTSLFSLREAPDVPLPGRTRCVICDGQCLKKTLGYEETDRYKDREIKKQINMDKTFNIAVVELKPCAGPIITQGLVQMRRLDARKLARILGLWNSKGHQRTPIRWCASWNRCASFLAAWKSKWSAEPGRPRGALLGFQVPPLGHSCWLTGFLDLSV